MLARDRLYPRPSELVTLLGLHDVSRFMSEPGATLDGLKLAFTFLMTSRGLPLVYYGDEIAMPGGNDPDNRRDFPGGFPGDTRDAFRAAGRSPEQQSVFEHVQRVARLRSELLPLRRGATLNLAVEEQTWVFARTLPGEPPVVVALNNAPEPKDLEAPAAPLHLEAGQRLADRLGGKGGATVENGRIRLRLPARGAAVLVPAR
jgi:glycosidase